MAILVELGVGIFVFLAEVSVLAALGLILPLRFTCSSAFRKKKREEWSATPRKKIGDVAASLASFAVIGACAYSAYSVINRLGLFLRFVAIPFAHPGKPAS